MGRLTRLALPALLGLAVYWALFGGAYSVFEVRDARRARAAEAEELRRIHAEMDSLRAWADSLELDDATLERLARERYGMIREGEVLYRFADPDTADAAADGAGGGDGR